MAKTLNHRESRVRKATEPVLAAASGLKLAKPADVQAD
jgi:hypothetical protein